MTGQKPLPPPSSSSFLINLLGGSVYVGTIVFMNHAFPAFDVVLAAIIGLLAATIPIVIGEIFLLKVNARPHLDLHVPGPTDGGRVMTKICGFIASLALILAGYWLIPEYRKATYDGAWIFLSLLAIPALAIGCLYIEYIDPRMNEPRDGLWHFGNLVKGRWRTVERKLVLNYLGSVLLRAYFLPLMFVYLYYFIAEFHHGDFGNLADVANFPLPDPHSGGYRAAKCFVGIWFVFASMDWMFALMGYVVVFRLLDSHIRSVEPTFFGWLICIICYSPFWEGLIIPYLLYDLYRSPQWYNWFTNYPVLMSFWGILVISSMICESLVTLTFGIRFSNLTYRGLISTGPYRLTKHPQYIAKAANRFFFLVPFLSLAGVSGAAKRTLMFGIFCLIYFFRARTEENHLSRYPEYVEYAKWVDDYGWLRGLARLFPFLKYSEERALAGRLF